MHSLVCLLSYKPGNCRERHHVPALTASPKAVGIWCEPDPHQWPNVPCDIPKGRCLSKLTMEVRSLGLPPASL